jgi:nucleoside-diphosphate-sugar epimerase
VEREFNDVRMVCDAYLRMLDKGIAGQTYNICSGQSYALKHIELILEQLTGHQIKIKVNQNFVRSNEVIKMCGSTDKLFSAIGRLPYYSLEDNLLSMLKFHEI